jgi:hypothetical protein
MKSILEFDLSEPDEAKNHLRAIHANNAFMVLWEMDQWLRNEIKYNNREVLQEIRDKLSELMEDVGISFDMYE